MNEADFHELVDDVLFAIEEAVEASDLDIDYENSNGMLTLTFEVNGSQIILSRQPAIREIWVAAKSGGFHFDLKINGSVQVWQNTVSKESLSDFLSQLFLSQGGEHLDFIF